MDCGSSFPAKVCNKYGIREIYEYDMGYCPVRAFSMDRYCSYSAWRFRSRAIFFKATTVGRLF
jgi:hypothetical protein